MSYSYPDIRNGVLYLEPHVNAPVDQDSVITPEVAEHLISYALPEWQRKKDQLKVEHFAKTMLNSAMAIAGKPVHGKCYMNGIAQIVVAVQRGSDGTIEMMYLIDGQHTCSAVVYSGETIRPSLRIVEVKSEEEARRDYFDVIDSATSARTLDDIIKARGWVKEFGLSVGDIKKLNKAVIMLEDHQLLENGTKKEQLIDSDVIEARLRRWATLAKQLFKVIATRNITWSRGAAEKQEKNSKLRDDKFVAHFLFLLKFSADIDLVWKFIDGIVHADNVRGEYPKGDPRYAITVWIQQAAENGYDLRIPDVIIGMSKAWNAFVCPGGKTSGLTYKVLPHKLTSHGRPGIEEASKCTFKRSVAGAGIGDPVVRQEVRKGVPYLT